MVNICICYLHSDLWTEELVVKFVLYAITHSYYTRFSHLNCVVELLLFK